jgi:phosphoribosylaminoimidazole-succinocarboxamide synthase
MEPIYEGKAKRLYSTDDPNVLRMEYKDDATAGNGAKKAQFENKGKMNKAITLLIYRMLETKGVRTHLVGDVDEINIDVKKVSILPLEVIVRNIAAGSFSKRMGVKEGTKFTKPIVEFSYKDDSLGDPFINDDYAREMGAATEAECAFLKEQALIVNNVLIDFFKEVGLTLVDSRLNLVVWQKIQRRLYWQTRFLQTHAVCGTSRRVPRWTRTDSVRIWATSWKPTKKCCHVFKRTPNHQIIT